ncbi:C6 zinc finger domain protein [Penicillium macrosclerotiorum]|uniref:C6 zinc finger domain protein n=1 Tax=Penicillium macrosclerotiorum TaxID=303699 RepID=UPI0025494462|nr:C6 zinc finger domain protein [Penicillium macrosclerotiorum]KAJ5698783.1 C6 zinc finger domain protein [Penicillium macrosclerotiorum]
MEAQPLPPQPPSPSREPEQVAHPQRRRRRRPAFSCQECRRRKIKCNQNNPCGHCVRFKTKCTYKTYRADEEPITGSIYFSRQQPAAQLQGHDIPGSSQPGVSSTGSAVTGSLFPNLLPEFESRRIIGESAPVLSEASSASLDHQLPEDTQKWQAIFEKPRDWGKSQWKGGANEFGLLMACYRAILSKESQAGSQQEHPEVSVLVSQAGDSLQDCKTIARNIKLSRPSRGPQFPGFGLPPLPREMADTMATLYIDYFESALRILHIPTFWSEYRKYWDDSDRIALNEQLKIYLVVGIGSSLYDHGDRAATLRNIDLVQQWIYTAQTWLSGPLEKDRLDVSGIQIFCLTILSRQIFSIGDDLTWTSVGSLIHGAMQIGLHRDPKNLPAKISVLQAEVRRRLWYTVLELVVQSSLDARMPPRISWNDFDTELPSHINDDQINDTTTELRPVARSAFTDTSAQLALIDSLSSRIQIVQNLNGLHATTSYDQALSFSSELMASLQACHRLTDNDVSTPFHRNMLDFLVRRFIIPLHYSFSNQAYRNPLFHYSSRISLDTALAIISPEPDSTFSRLISIGSGPFRESIRCATSVISLELLRHVENQQFSGTLQRTHQYREFLKKAVRDLIDLSEERIKLGETNVKNHMFLCMILAQVEATEASAPVDLQVVRAARDSLEMCSKILMMREDTGIMQSSKNLDLTIARMEDNGTGNGLGLDFDRDLFFFDPTFS